MANTFLEQFRVADVIEWHERKQLKLNPHFQRRAVWTPPAKVFLIDTILRQLPMPKIYMRTRVNLETKRSFREVVDGQQRIRAILEFAQDKLVLSKRANEFAGLSYSTLDDDLQEKFLAYPIAVDQLMNASDDDVLEIFARLNSYTVTLKPAELRHAQFQSNFKWLVHEKAKQWKVFWEEYKVVSMRDRLRMQDDSLVAEMIGVLVLGIADGGQAQITKLYQKFEKQDFDDAEIVEIGGQFDAVSAKIVEVFGEVLAPSPQVSSSPHFLMLFAAVAHAMFGLPAGQLGNALPAREEQSVLSDPEAARANIQLISEILEADEVEQNWRDFKKASSASTQRISSRKVRFPTFYKALMPEPL